MSKKEAAADKVEAKRLHALKAKVKRKQVRAEKYDKKVKEHEFLKRYSVPREPNSVNLGFSSGIYIVGRPERRPETGCADTRWTTPWPVDEDDEATDLRSDAKRLFPTTLFPAASFEAGDDGRSIEHWTALFAPIWEQVEDVHRNAKPQKSELAEESRPTTASARRWQRQLDAEQALQLVRFIREVLQHIQSPVQDALRVASAAYYMGRLAERQEVRGFEEKIVAAERNSRRALKAASSTNAEHAENRSKYAPRVEALISQGMGYSAAVEQVADEFGRSARTVRDHTKQLAHKRTPRKKGKR